MPYLHSAGSAKRKQRQQLTVPCDCNLCQGKHQTCGVVRRRREAFGKNLGIDCYEHEEEEESSLLDDSVEIKIDAISKDSPSDSEESQQSMKCLLVSSGMEDNSEVGFHVEPLNKILTTSRPSYESLLSADDTSDDTRSETSSNSSVDEDDCETLFDPVSSNSSDSQSENSNDTAKSITRAVESQMIEELLLYVLRLYWRHFLGISIGSPLILLSVKVPCLSYRNSNMSTFYLLAIIYLLPTKRLGSL